MTAIPCQRCGVQCQASGPGDPHARPLRHADTGVCASCGITIFLRDHLALLPPEAGPGEALRMPHIQAQIALVLTAGQSDVLPTDIEWERVIANWSLP